METAMIGEVMAVVAGGFFLLVGPGVMLMTIVGGLCSMVRGDA